MEEELKTAEDKVPKIRAILASVDHSSLSLTEQKVILCFY